MTNYFQALERLVISLILSKVGAAVLIFGHARHVPTSSSRVAKHFLFVNSELLCCYDYRMMGSYSPNVNGSSAVLSSGSHDVSQYTLTFTLPAYSATH